MTNLELAFNKLITEYEQLRDELSVQSKVQNVLPHSYAADMGVVEGMERAIELLAPFIQPVDTSPCPNCGAMVTEGELATTPGGRQHCINCENDV